MSLPAAKDSFGAEWSIGHCSINVVRRLFRGYVPPERRKSSRRGNKDACTMKRKTYSRTKSVRVQDCRQWCCGFVFCSGCGIVVSRVAVPSNSCGGIAATILLVTNKSALEQDSTAPIATTGGSQSSTTNEQHQKQRVSLLQTRTPIPSSQQGFF